MIKIEEFGVKSSFTDDQKYWLGIWVNPLCFRYRTSAGFSKDSSIFLPEKKFIRARKIAKDYISRNEHLLMNLFGESDISGSYYIDSNDFFIYFMKKEDMLIFKLSEDKHNDEL